MEEKVIDIICKYQRINPKTITLQSNLMKDIGLSSFDVLNLVCIFEEEFQVEIPDRSIASVRTVEDIVQTIQRLLSLA